MTFDKKIAETIHENSKNNSNLNEFLKTILNFEKESNGQWKAKYKELLEKYTREEE